MAKFEGRLQLDFGDWTDKGLGRIAQTLSPVYWYSDDIEFLIRQGSYSDGATVPWWLWWFEPAWGSRGSWAALLHDILCETYDSIGPFQCIRSRSDCDRQYYLALRALGIGMIRARLLWLGVRLYSITQVPKSKR